MFKFGRFLLPAGAFGYYTIKQKVDNFTSSLPDFRSYLPNIDLNSWSASISDTSKTLNEWLDEANQSIKNSATHTVSTRQEEIVRPETEIRKPLTKILTREIKSNASNVKENKDKVEVPTVELVGLRKEIERLKKENRELRTAARRAGSQGGSNNVKRTLKKSLIEQYSEVLDELSGHDSSYQIADHLPKVVVVGDQSSGKTSVLEMIAGARIFPRGAGQMMTRAPVQVTLCEGPYHIARFNDSTREYDLTQESELADLRREIEERMRRSVQSGNTVSNQVVSLTIQGPGIQRMVLVDLPGIIGTNTTQLAPDTKERIKEMVTGYMSNPNAIILCIQDGSVDAERSLFTDLAREVDKEGRRTIVVMTKVDIAEATHTNVRRIKQILDGEVFPMKALGYYAVVAGKSGKNEDIQEIRDYEEQFFLTSSLREKGIIDPSQCTTRNLSAKVSECFWGMVRASIEQQADAYRATLYNLEAEWNHLFPHKRQLTRDELFHNGKNEIMNEVAKLSRLSTKDWDQFINTKLWERVNEHVMKNIYFPASKDRLHFSAKVDIELQRWVESFELPKLAIQVAQDSLRHQFNEMLGTAERNQNQQHDHPKSNNKLNSNSNQDQDDAFVYEKLKRAVINDALERHEWKGQALNVLKVVQMEALSKQTMMTRDNWEKSIDFLLQNLSALMKSTENELNNLLGAGFAQRWLKWKSITPDQSVNQKIQDEFERLIGVHDLESNVTFDLKEHELQQVLKNLSMDGIDVGRETIEKLWIPYQRNHFLGNELSRAQECRRMFNFYENDLECGTDCSHVLFFWRIKRMLEFTANSLRRQILEHECRRIERDIVDVLEEYSEDEARKTQLLSGKRIELAEELKRVRQVREKLDEFITALNQE